MPNFKKNKGFQLKSGNTTPFKNMGSGSPIKQYANIGLKTMLSPIVKKGSPLYQTEDTKYTPPKENETKAEWLIRIGAFNKGHTDIRGNNTNIWNPDANDGRGGWVGTGTDRDKKIEEDRYEREFLDYYYYQKKDAIKPVLPQHIIDIREKQKQEEEEGGGKDEQKKIYPWEEENREKYPWETEEGEDSEDGGEEEEEEEPAPEGDVKGDPKQGESKKSWAARNEYAVEADDDREWDNNTGGWIAPEFATTGVTAGGPSPGAISSLGEMQTKTEQKIQGIDPDNPMVYKKRKK
jgi:hypothetical protein